jgi:hypothetical protein
MLSWLPLTFIGGVQRQWSPRDTQGTFMSYTHLSCRVLLLTVVSVGNRYPGLLESDGRVHIGEDTMRRLPLRCRLVPGPDSIRLRLQVAGELS